MAESERPYEPSTTYTTVCTYSNVLVKVPSRVGNHLTCGIVTDNKIVSFPFGQKENGINKCNLDQALNYEPKPNQIVFIHKGIQIENGVICNCFFRGLEAEDFGKRINGNLEIKNKEVPGKGVFTEINITKTPGTSTVELKIGSPKHKGYPIQGTSKNIAIVPISVKEVA